MLTENVIIDLGLKILKLYLNVLTIIQYLQNKAIWRDKYIPKYSDIDELSTSNSFY